MAQSSKCLNDKTLYKYIDNQLTEKERIRVDRHINECPECLASLASLIKLATAPVSDEEKKILDTIEQVPVEKRLEEVLGKRDQKPIFPKIIEALQTLFNPITKPILAHPGFLKPAYIFASFFIFLIGLSGVRFYNTTLQIMYAEKRLHENHAISANTARLSGNYRYNRITKYMDEEPEQSYIKDSREHIKKAQKHRSKSTKASLLLAQTYIIQNQIKKADSILHPLLQDENTSIAVVNDVGVLYFQQEQYKVAEQYFQKCLDKDPDYLNAYYNLSLTKYKLDKIDKAIEFIQHYIEFEKNETWNDVAQNLLREYQVE